MVNKTSFLYSKQFLIAVLAITLIGLSLLIFALTALNNSPSFLSQQAGETTEKSKREGVGEKPLIIQSEIEQARRAKATYKVLSRPATRSQILSMLLGKERWYKDRTLKLVQEWDPEAKLVYFHVIADANPTPHLAYKYYSETKNKNFTVYVSSYQPKGEEDIETKYRKEILEFPPFVNIRDAAVITTRKHEEAYSDEQFSEYYAVFEGGSDHWQTQLTGYPDPKKRFNYQVGLDEDVNDYY